MLLQHKRRLGPEPDPGGSAGSKLYFRIRLLPFAGRLPEQAGLWLVSGRVSCFIGWKRLGAFGEGEERLCLRKDLLHPADFSGIKADLDPMGVGRGVRQDIFDDASCQRAAALVVLLDDVHFETGLYLASFCAAHRDPFRER